MKRLFRLLFLLLLWSSASAQGDLLDTTSFFKQDFLRILNTKYHEGAPVISPDGKTLYFFVSNHPDNNDGTNGSQDIWFAKKRPDGKWNKPIHASNTLNRNKSNQVLAVVDNGESLIVTGGESKKVRGISISHNRNGDWTKPIVLDIPLVADKAIGKYFGGTMTNDRKVLLLYYAEVKDSKMSDMYVCFQKGPYSYSSPVKIGLNTSADEFGPFVCSDGETMYFSSDRKGGLGQADIYVTTRTDDTWLNWSLPENIGNPVNTNRFDAYFSMDDEMVYAYTTWAYMTPDGGSLDIIGIIPRYKTAIEGKVLDAETGDPIKTDFEIHMPKLGYLMVSSDENGDYHTAVRDHGKVIFFVDAEHHDDEIDTVAVPFTVKDTLIAYDIYLRPKHPEILVSGTVTDKETGVELDAHILFKHVGGDIETDCDYGGFYETQLHQGGQWSVIASVEGYNTFTEDFDIDTKGHHFIEFEKNMQLTVKEKDIVLGGIVTDVNTSKPIGGAKVTYQSASGKVAETLTDNDGTYRFVLPESGHYILRSGRKGYLNADQETTVKLFEEEAVNTQDIDLTPVQIGQKVRIENIYFDFNRATLRKESNEELDHLVYFLTQNPTVEIELSGHTDNRGSDAYNLKLSRERSAAVMNYLLSKGIQKERLTSKGYGESQPEVLNDTDANRQINRRVQFVILAL